MKHIIVGVDTGKRSAVVCIDLNGRIVHHTTGTFVGLDWFIKNIKDSGSPVIIAGDKRKADTAIHKLAAIFSATIFTPQTDISVKRKKRISEGVELQDFHQRDALSAAVTAYNAYANKLKQTERFMTEKKFEDIDMAKAMVIKRYSMHEVVENKKSGRGRPY